MRRVLVAMAAPGILLLAVAGGLLFPGRSSRALVNCDTDEAALDPAEQRMLAGINAERAAAGLAPLAPSPGLARAAAWKSADASASGPTFSHQDSLGRMPGARARDCGYPYGAGENAAWGYSSPDATLAAWMASPGHRANILGARYRVVGIGAHGSSWTTNFGTVDDSNLPAPPAATAAVTQPPAATPTPASPAAPPQPAASPPPPAGGRPESPAEDAPRASGVSLPLPAGVSLVTYVGLEQRAESALASLAGAATGIYEWNSAANRWEKFLPGGPAYVNTFVNMKPGRVYVLELLTPATWTY